MVGIVQNSNLMCEKELELGWRSPSGGEQLGHNGKRSALERRVFQKSGTIQAEQSSSEKVLMCSSN